MLHMLIQAAEQIQDIHNQLAVPSVGVEELLSAVVINYLSTTGIQYLKISKRKGFAWINYNTPWVTRGIVAMSSFITAAGIHKTWEPATGTLIISGISFWAIAHAAKHVVFNYAMQHGWWKVLYANREGQMIQEAEQKAAGNLAPAV